MDDIKSITPLEPEKSVPFVGESLKILRNEIGNEATLLGFCGAPFTLGRDIVKGARAFALQGDQKDGVRCAGGVRGVDEQAYGRRD